MSKKVVSRAAVTAIAIMSGCSLVMAQAPGGGKGGPGGGKGGPPRPVLSVTSTAWPDGGEVPMTNAGRRRLKRPILVCFMRSCDYSIHKCHVA